MRILISMPEKFLSEVDNVASSENRTRSELIREALRTYMRRPKFTNEKAEATAAILDELFS